MITESVIKEILNDMKMHRDKLYHLRMELKSDKANEGLMEEIRILEEKIDLLKDILEIEPF